MLHTTDQLHYKAIGLDNSLKDSVELKYYADTAKYLVSFKVALDTQVAFNTLLSILTYNGTDYNLITFDFTSRCYLIWTKDNYTLEVTIDKDFYNTSTVFRAYEIDNLLTTL